MTVELIVPSVGESITEVQVGEWRKAPGDPVEQDEVVVELESDKATVELPSPAAGTLGEIVKKNGEAAEVGEVIGYIQEGAGASTGKQAEKEAGAEQEGAAAAAAGSAQAVKTEEEQPAARDTGAASGDGRQQKEADQERGAAAPEDVRVMPAAQRLLQQHGLEPGGVKATGPGGRLLKEDVERHVAEQRRQSAPQPAPEAAPRTAPETAEADGREEESIPMSPMRRRIAERLVEAQQTAALLTTYNECDLSEIIALRKTYQEDFQKKYGIKLGFMSFFVKACIEALKEFPAVNSEIRDTDIVYKNYYDIGIAVASGKGLVVPVLRNAERMSFAELELAIADFGGRALENKITLEELQGGTFTISNGGVFGSLMSMPIVNPPQSGILGMHAIQDRPVARDGQVVIRPMMYLALTYDHRIVDGREAVSFLRRVKECVEKPTRIMIEV